MKRSLFITALVVVALALGAGGWYFAAHRTPPGTPAKQSGTQQTNPISTPPANGSQPANGTLRTYLVKVYFSKHPASDNDPGAVFAVNRASANLGVARFAITELLKGPSANEKAAGYFTTARLRTAPSTCNGQDFALTIVNSTATLQFCRPFDHLGVVADGQAKSELEATLKQFSSAKKTIILNYQGHCEFDLSGMDLCKQ